jgi:hypothetical protein
MGQGGGLYVFASQVDTASEEIVPRRYRSLGFSCKVVCNDEAL